MKIESWQKRRTKTKEKDGGRSTINKPRYDNRKINGGGPILSFIGDEMMYVNPVLAQGFTIAMESRVSVVWSIECILVRCDDYGTDPTFSNAAPPYHPNLVTEN
jgi:hypothetical protein